MTLASRRVFYISYNGMLDPLGQSQVIPYLKELSKLGVRFWLLSFERHQAFEPAGIERAKQLRAELGHYGIEWFVLRYHQKPSLAATAYDVARGVQLGSRLVTQKKIDMVHARAHIPAVIALVLKRRFGTKFIFDVRGLMAEEYIDAGHWKRFGIPARITKASEARVLRAADGVVTLTNALWKEMQRWPGLAGRTVAHEIVPCCIDLEKFKFNAAQREALRNELNVADRFVLIYSGSIGGWYMTDEMAAFFSAIKVQHPGAYFLWLTQGPHSLIERAMTKHGVAATDYGVRKVEPANMSNYLSAGDAGIAFYRPGISRLGTSPIKVSEYLACGLPVVINAKIGDSDDVISNGSAGVVVQDFDSHNYGLAAATILNFATNPTEIRHRNRAIAERLFDLKQVGATRYARLYEGI